MKESPPDDTLPFTSGVPQGSILGPILFIIYINDIPSHVKSSIYVFANDTKLMKAITVFNVSVILQSDLNSIHEWCVEWKLHLSIPKCHFLNFSLSQYQTETTYLMNNIEIETVDSHRDLSVFVSSNLSWSHHYSNICSNAYKTLHFICRNIGSSSGPFLKKCLYISLVQSKLSYCSQLRLLKDIKQLETVQHHVTKVTLSYLTLSYEGLTNLWFFPFM